MSSYTRFRYHLVFSTKNREPLITSEVENLIYTAIRRSAEEVGAKIVVMNGIETHIHVIAAVPPDVRFSDFVREIKTASSRSVRKAATFPHGTFEWQPGYGAFTVNPDDMGGLIAYVKNQKEHHARDTLIPRYEKSSE